MKVITSVRTILSLILVSSVLSACALGAKRVSPGPATPLPVPSPAPSPQAAPITSNTPEVAVKSQAKRSQPYTLVRVFYGTDRNITDSNNPKKRYGKERSDVTYGVATVSIPDTHVLGELEAPSVWEFEFWDNPKKHVVLLDASQRAQGQFLRELMERVQASPEKKAFVFVHGYNVSFEDAARRTAQLTHDMKFKGAPIFYSWPSQASLSGYPVDETNIEWSTLHITKFLKDVALETGAQKIYLIAHSMGNRGLTKGFIELQRELSARQLRPFQEIILTAPDIDAEVFKRDIAPKITTANAKVTLYASSNDKALKASKYFHGYPRAGDSGDNLVLLRNIETIDVSDLEDSFWSLGHSYFVEEKSVVNDMSMLFHYGVRAHERTSLQPVNSSYGTYWKLRSN